MAETRQQQEFATDGGYTGSAGRRIGELSGNMVGVMDNARSSAQNVVNQLPAAADATRQMMDQANRQMQSSSDEMLMVGTALSAGIALGLFVTGTNRLAVALVLLPSIAMGATLMDRRSRPTP